MLYDIYSNRQVSVSALHSPSNASPRGALGATLQLGATIQLPSMLDGKVREEERIQERLRQAQSESNEEYEEELLVSDRNERRARVAFRLHAGKQKEVDTEGTLKSMLAMIGIRQRMTKSFRVGKESKYFDDPRMTKIDASEFVDFYAKLFRSLKMEQGNSLFALREIAKAQRAQTSIPGNDHYIDPDTLRREFQRSLVAKISASQVLDIVREIDTTGTDKIEPRDFLIFMDAKAGDEIV